MTDKTVTKTGTRTKNYLIHDNGGTPFKVTVAYKNVAIYKHIKTGGFQNTPFMNLLVNKVFIGKSPLNKMTSYSGGHGPNFDGNSILLEVPEILEIPEATDTGLSQIKYSYIFIGREITKFTAFHKIVKYVSPVGNNDVPYPFAIDEQSNVYLMIEDVVLKSLDEKYFDDPYDYYYASSLITPDISGVPQKEPKIKNFNDISEYYIGEDQYTMRYHPFPGKDYNFIVPELGENMYKVSPNGRKTLITKRAYIKLMKDFGDLMSFTPLKKRILQKRR